MKDFHDNVDKFTSHLFVSVNKRHNLLFARDRRRRQSKHVWHRTAEGLTEELEEKEVSGNRIYKRLMKLSHNLLYIYIYNLDSNFIFIDRSWRLAQTIHNLINYVYQWICDKIRWDLFIFFFRCKILLSLNYWQN